MGFGRGTGFTVSIIKQTATFVLKAGGGKISQTITQSNPTYTLTVS